MTRGRKKDITLAPSRSLTQQRDYRARRAKYVDNLEEENRRLKEEVVWLRSEISGLRAGVVEGDPRLRDASTDLLCTLAKASDALRGFQDIAFPSQCHPTIREEGRPRTTFLPPLSPCSECTSSTHSEQYYPTCSDDSKSTQSRHSLSRILCDDSPGVFSAVAKAASESHHYYEGRISPQNVYDPPCSCVRGYVETQRRI